MIRRFARLNVRWHSAAARHWEEHPYRSLGVLVAWVALIQGVQFRKRKLQREREALLRETAEAERLLFDPLPDLVRDMEQDPFSFIESDPLLGTYPRERLRRDDLGEEPDIQRLYSSSDAQVWAEEFVKVRPDVDQGLMIGWFANAMETAKTLDGTSN